jgi:hypothetical protein
MLPNSLPLQYVLLHDAGDRVRRPAPPRGGRVIRPGAPAKTSYCG